MSTKIGECYLEVEHRKDIEENMAGIYFRHQNPEIILHVGEMECKIIKNNDKFMDFASKPAAGGRDSKISTMTGGSLIDRDVTHYDRSPGLKMEMIGISGVFQPTTL